MGARLLEPSPSINFSDMVWLRSLTVTLILVAVSGCSAETAPTTSPGGPSQTGPGDGFTGPLPSIEPCSLLSIGEIQAGLAAATPPAGPDDLDDPDLLQCSYGLFRLNVFPPMEPGVFKAGVDGSNIDVIEIAGIGDWAEAQVNVANSETSIENTVVSVAAGNSIGTIALVPLFDVKQGDVEYNALLQLLESALGRL